MTVVIIIAIIVFVCYCAQKSGKSNNSNNNSSNSVNSTTTNTAANESSTINTNSASKTNKSATVDDMVEDAIDMYYEDSVWHILYAKEAFHEAYKVAKEVYNFYCNEPLPDKSIINMYTESFNRLKAAKLKFIEVYGKGVFDIDELIRLQEKGIYTQNLNSNRMVVSIEGDADKVIKYLSDRDLEFKSATEKRVKRFCIMNAKVAKHEGEVIFNFAFWSEYANDIFEIGFAHKFDSTIEEIMLNTAKKWDEMTEDVNMIYEYTNSIKRDFHI